MSQFCVHPPSRTEPITTVYADWLWCGVCGSLSKGFQNRTRVWEKPDIYDGLTEGQYEIPADIRNPAVIVTTT